MIAIARNLALLATLLFVAQSVAAQGMLASGTIMTICSPDGTKDIVIDTNGEPVEVNHGHCFKCFIVAGGLPPEPVSVAMSHGKGISTSAQIEDVHHAHLATGFTVRAPPRG